LRELLKKIAVTVGGLSLGVLVACILILLSGFIPLSVSTNGADSLAITLDLESANKKKKVWGDMPIDQSMSDYGIVVPELKTKKEFYLAKKARAVEQAFDGRGGGFYFGKAKDLLSKELGVFDIQLTKSHLLKLTYLKDVGLSGFSLRQKMENLVQGVPIGAPVIGKLTSNFGKRSSPFGREADFHTGIDIASIFNSTVVSSAEGEVIFAGRKGAYGKTILIKHKNGLETLYAHLSSILIKEGDKVHRGEKIGLLGTSGKSTGPHLHYEVRVDGRPVNPRSYIEIAKILKSVG